MFRKFDAVSSIGASTVCGSELGASTICDGEMHESETEVSVLNDGDDIWQQPECRSIISDEIIYKLANLKDPIGRKPTDANMAAKRESFAVPDALWIAFNKGLPLNQREEEIDKTVAINTEVVTENYATFFHNLLHLEEIELINCVKIYNCNATSFKISKKLIIYELKDSLYNTQHLELGNSLFIQKMLSYEIKIKNPVKKNLLYFHQI